MIKNIGGDRLGSGAKMNVALHGYQRSNHDLSYIWKSTMAPGTLVPFMNLVGLPGDTFDIDLDAIVKTHPTIGPLFGSFKLQLDIFTAPIRLYNRNLHNSKLGIGMNMSQIKLPQIALKGNALVDPVSIPFEFQQINQSCILAYLGIRGLGYQNDTGGNIIDTKNAVPYLAFWDIFKNYYANKQEENAYVIHGELPSVSSITFNGNTLPEAIVSYLDMLDIVGENITPDNITLQFTTATDCTVRQFAFDSQSLRILEEGKHIQVWVCKYALQGDTITGYVIDNNQLTDLRPSLTSFPLANIDLMRNKILGYNENPIPDYLINEEEISPYSLPLQIIPGETHKMYAVCGQEGLPVKTYQSDIFNNWIQTEWIEGTNSIAAITAISTAGDSFTLDTLNLSQKVYNLLNRIAVSGGSYSDWIEATYDSTSKWKPENPEYHGGLSKEIVFQEVISQAASADEPLGTLAGKGVMGHKHKGGKVIIHIDEPCHIIGIVSITPRIDYSQGNEWSSNLKTLDDLHKPALDGIGYQDLITDQMAFWDTTFVNNVRTFKSAGKQPAWLNYMTNHNKNYGNFADPRTQMFMTLDRKYTFDRGVFTDLTTYIDPSKFNYAFAQTDLSAQNFWTQIACNIQARRKMSAKIIPNL